MNWFKKLVPNLNLLLVAVLIAGLFTFLLPTQPAQAQSWLSEYAYRQGFTINGTTAGAQTNYTMQLTVHRYGPGQAYQGLIDSLPFTRFASNPLYDVDPLGGLGHFTVGYDATWIIEDGNDPNTLLLYHGGGDGGPPHGGVQENEIGLLIGNKATNVFTPYNSHQVIVGSGPPGSWDSSYLRLGNVVFKDGTFYLYYQGGSGGPGAAGLATSTDGRIFTKYPGNPVATDPASVQLPSVFIEGNNWYMYYTAIPGGVRTFKVKTSTDGITWVGGTVVKVGSWTSAMPWIEGIHAYKMGSTYVIIYDTFGDGSAYNPQIGAAYSSTPTGTFVDYPGNPILAKSGVPGSTDQHAVTMGSLYWDGEKWRIYYLGTNWDYPIWISWNSPWKPCMAYGETLQSSTDAAYLGGSALSWPNDIRFTTNDGTTLLDYRVVSNTTSTATVYVEFDSIPISPGTADFYMYYGKLNDSGASNGALTLSGVVFSDNFNRTDSGTIGNDWQEIGVGNGNILSNQLEVVPSSEGGYANHIQHPLSFSQNLTTSVEIKVPSLPVNTAWNFIIADETPGTNGLFGLSTGRQTDGTRYIAALYAENPWDIVVSNVTVGTWYTFKIVYNNNSRNATFYVDSTAYKTDVGGWSDANWAPYANNVTLGRDPNPADPTVNWYVDNVVVVGEGVSPPPTWDGWASQEGGSPEVITYAATGIGTNTTTLQGRIGSLGNLGSITQRGFDWGTTTAYGSEWAETGSWGIGDFSRIATGLVGSTLYHYRAKAYSGGIWSYGDDVTFTTQAASAPQITTGTAVDLTTSGATLQGTLNSLGDYSPVYVYFQYGTTTSYGTSTAEQTKTATGGFSQAITGLGINTLYHFRTVVRYGTSSYVYGSDATFTTTGGVATPGAPTNFGASPSTTQISLAWNKGTGATRTMVRYATDTYPATITSGTQLYFDTGTTYIFTIAQSGVTYYFSAWSEAAGVYSTSRATTSGSLGIPGLLPPPNRFQVESVRVFKDYLVIGDLIFVASLKVIMDAMPAEDIKDCVKVQLLDSTILKAQFQPTQWGFRPASLYLSPGHGITWDGNYTIKLEGRPEKWVSVPMSPFGLTAGTWIADLSYLPSWVLDAAERMEDYYELDLVTYSSEGRVLTETGGEWFSAAIPNLRIQFPELFSAGMEGMPGLEEGEVVYEGAGNMTVAWGDYIAQQFQDLGESAGLSGESAGGIIWIVFTFIVAGLVGLVAGPSMGFILCLPLVGTGVYLRLLDMPMVIAVGVAIFVLAMFVYFIQGKVSA